MRGFFFNQKMTRLSVSFLLVAAIAVLAGCTNSSGGGSAIPATTTGGVATTIQLSPSLPQVLSSSTSTTILTAVVLDASGQALAGKLVTFANGGDSTAYYTNVKATTDANGIATATLNIGSNMANRTITVSATADAAVGTTAVTVAGTTITTSGNTSLALNASTALIVSVKNSEGAPVPRVPLVITSLNGNGIAKLPASGVTDANGQAVVTVTATSATTLDTITISGAGATHTQDLTITTTSTSFAFTSPIAIVAPATAPEILVNTTTPISILWTVNGVPQVGKTVNFYSTRGVIAGNPATTNASGVATVNISSTSTGAVSISASAPANIPSASLDVVFITNTANAIAAQAVPGTIGVNASGSTANQSVISVVVRDADNNLVKNANVSFNFAADPSGGKLSAPLAVTDITGTASVNYIAGSSSSGVNQELITATVDSINGSAITPITTSTTLTVAGQTYFVRLETDNTVLGGGVTNPQYTKQYYALVTDVSGHAVVNATVGFTLRPAVTPATSFAKGKFIVSGTGWTQSVAKSCASEDSNLNGIRDFIGTTSDEDVNGNGQLDPYGVAVVNDTAKTDATGYAVVTIKYNKNYAYWVQLNLEARTGITGNDPPAVVTVVLPGAASDYTDITIAPPGEVSPFGVGNLCSDTK
jgi:hypothetical protein